MVPRPHFIPRYDWLVDIWDTIPYPLHPGGCVSAACRGKGPQRYFRLTLAGNVPPMAMCICRAHPSFNRLSPCRIQGVPCLRAGVGGGRTGHQRVHFTGIEKGVGPSSPLQVGGSPARGIL